MQARGWGPLVLAPGPRRRRTDPTHRYARSRAPPYNPTPHSAGSSFYTYTDTGGRVYNTDTHRRSKKTRERERSTRAGSEQKKKASPARSRQSERGWRAGPRSARILEYIYVQPFSLALSFATRGRALVFIFRLVSSSASRASYSSPAAGARV